MQEVFKSEYSVEITIQPDDPSGEKNLPKEDEQDGWHDCEYCKGSGNLKFSFSNYDSSFKFTCPVCNGKGRYDWVTNVMKKARWSEFERLGGTIKKWRNQDTS